VVLAGLSKAGLVGGIKNKLAVSLPVKLLVHAGISGLVLLYL